MKISEIYHISCMLICAKVVQACVMLSAHYAAGSILSGQHFLSSNSL